LDPSPQPRADEGQRPRGGRGRTAHSSPLRAPAQAAALAADPNPLDQRRLVWLLVFGDELVAVQIGGAADVSEAADDLQVGFAVAEATEPLAHDSVIVDHQDAMVRSE
jgi:hypothetical protein